MSSFSIQCAQCKQILTFSESQIGARGPCAYCGAFVVAEPPSPAPFFGVGRLMGLTFLVPGAVLWWIASSMLASSGVTFRVFIAGPVFAWIGLSMLVLPGAPMSLRESREGLKAKNHWVIEAPILHKIAWTIAGVIGFVFTISMF